jgi:hypothetical protein
MNASSLDAGNLLDCFKVQGIRACNRFLEVVQIHFVLMKPTRVPRKISLGLGSSATFLLVVHGNKLKPFDSSK